MNPEYESQEKENFGRELDVNNADSIDDFIKELEEKERDLHISFSGTVVEIEEIDIEQGGEAEISKMIETYQQSNPSFESTPSMEITGNNEFVSHHSVSNQQASTSFEQEVSQLRSEVSKLILEREEMQESLRRRQNDFENLRNRTERERGEVFRNLLSNLATRMFPVVDNLSRAIDSASIHVTEKTNDFQQFIDGIELVNQQLTEVLEEMGIQHIICVGRPFDPHFHEAVATKQTDDFPHNTVVEELLRGYSIDDKVIRHAMVRVSTSNSEDSLPELELD